MIGIDISECTAVFKNWKLIYTKVLIPHQFEKIRIHLISKSSKLKSLIPYFLGLVCLPTYLRKIYPLFWFAKLEIAHTYKSNIIHFIRYNPTLRSRVLAHLAGDMSQKLQIVDLSNLFSFARSWIRIIDIHFIFIQAH